MGDLVLRPMRARHRARSRRPFLTTLIVALIGLGLFRWVGGIYVAPPGEGVWGETAIVWRGDDQPFFDSPAASPDRKGPGFALVRRLPYWGWAYRRSLPADSPERGGQTITVGAPAADPEPPAAAASPPPAVLAAPSPAPAAPGSGTVAARPAPAASAEAAAVQPRPARRAEALAAERSAPGRATGSRLPASVQRPSGPSRFPASTQSLAAPTAARDRQLERIRREIERIRRETGPESAAGAAPQPAGG